MNACTTAAEAIACSVDRGEITYADEVCKFDLMALCDDCVELEGVIELRSADKEMAMLLGDGIFSYKFIEFWGTDKSGNEWRVNVRL